MLIGNPRTQSITHINAKRSCIHPLAAAFALAGICLFGHARQALAYYDPIFHNEFERAFYVSANNGDDSNDGSHQHPWQTINRAVQDSNGAPAGSTVYVAPGTYPELVEFMRDNISLLGYTTVPGDQPTILANVPVNTSSITAGDTSAFPPFDPDEMPLVLGSNPSADICIKLENVTGIIIKNFNVKNCYYGVDLGKNSKTLPGNHRLFNVNVMDIGPTDGSYSGPALSIGLLTSLFGNSDLIENCLIINSAAEGLTIVGYETQARNIHIYSTGVQAGPSTDYYVIVYGSRNRVSDSYAWRLPGAEHIGHGFTIKDDADQLDGTALIEAHDNVFERNVSVNMGEGFVVRHRGVSNNLFVDNKAHGTYAQPLACTSVDVTPSRTKFYGSAGIVIRDGASDNTFTNTQTFDVCDAVEIVDTIEDGGNLVTPPSGNLIQGLQANNSQTGIYYRHCPYENADASCPVGESAGSNRIENSTFTATHTIFEAEIPSDQMQYANDCFGGVADNANDPGDFWQGNASDLATITPNQFTNSQFVNINNYPPGQTWPAASAACDN